MKLFLDTADVATVSQFWSTGLIDGLTTNPTLMMKAGQMPDKVYHQHHPEDHHGPNALELFCEMHPDEPECLVYDD